MSTLYVEDYGAVGDGVTDDTAAIQAAIDAAADGDTVLAENTYVISENGAVQCGSYTNTYKCLHLNTDNLTFWGNNFILAAMPAHTRFCMFLIGDGGYQTGGFPGIDELLATGHICRGVTLKGVTTDCSVLTAQNIIDLAALSNVFSATVGAAFSQDFTIDGVTVDIGWGNNGGVGFVQSCRGFTVKDTEVTTVYHTGYFADGAKNFEYDNCSTVADIYDGQTRGIVIGTSSDYESYSANGYIHDCNIAGTRSGIAVSGERNQVLDNTVTQKDVNLSGIAGITVTVGYSAVNDCDSDGSAEVRGNTVQRPVGATYVKGWGVYINGRAAGFGGDPLLVHNTMIRNNIFNRLTYGVVWGTSAQNNIFTDNTLNTVNAIQVTTGGETAINNQVNIEVPRTATLSNAARDGAALTDAAVGGASVADALAGDSTLSNTARDGATVTDAAIGGATVSDG